MKRNPLTSQMTKVTGGMKVVSVESTDYRILCDDTAIIQSSKNPITAFFPPNSVAFNGTRISVTHLPPVTFTPLVKIIVIPYSLRAISDLNGPNALSSNSPPTELEYLVFEFGSELQSICYFAFAKLQLRSLFFPPSVCFLYPRAFVDCSSVGSVYFGRHSVSNGFRVVHSTTVVCCVLSNSNSLLNVGGFRVQHLRIVRYSHQSLSPRQSNSSIGANLIRGRIVSHLL
jgi:hypothetical protein